MNRSLLLLVLLMGIQNSTFSQEKKDSHLWHLTIVNSNNAKGIERATVAISRKRYFSTNVDGVINIDKSLIDLNDSIRVSCIGYKTLQLSSNVIQKFPDTVRLSVSVTSLKEVKINPTSSTGITLESVKTPYNTHMHPYPNHEFAQYIPNQEKLSGTITSVAFELNDDLRAIEMPFNVEILSKSTDSIYPDTAMIMDSIIVYNPKKKRHLSVELSKYHIQIPENGFFVVFQTLSPSYYSNETVWYDGREHYKIPGINIYLKEKNKFYGKCCDIDWPDRKGFYCLLSGGKDRESWVKKDQWIVYVEGINFGISATITP